MFCTSSSKTNAIIYSILVHITTDLRDDYAQAVQTCAVTFASNEKIDELPESELGHAIDHHTICITRNLRGALQDSGLNHTPAHELVPSAVSLWNHLKGGQDVVSRQLKNIKVNLRRLHPRAYIWQRFINLSLLNAHMFQRLLKLESTLTQVYSYRMWKGALIKSKSFETALMIHVVLNWQPQEQPFDIQNAQNSEIRDEIGPEVDAIVGLRDRRRAKLPYCNESEGKRIRLDDDAVHAPTSGPSAKCILCRTPSTSSSARNGYIQVNTTHMCSHCGPSLCKFPFGNNNRSCFQKFHSRRTLIVADRPPFRGGSGRMGVDALIMLHEQND